MDAQFHSLISHVFNLLPDTFAKDFRDIPLDDITRVLVGSHTETSVSKSGRHGVDGADCVTRGERDLYYPVPLSSREAFRISKSVCRTTTKGVRRGTRVPHWRHNLHRITRGLWTRSWSAYRCREVRTRCVCQVRTYLV